MFFNNYTKDDVLRIQQVIDSDQEQAIIEQELSLSFNLTLSEALGMIFRL